MASVKSRPRSGPAPKHHEHIAAPACRLYARRRPEHGVLHRVLYEHAEEPRVNLILYHGILGPSARQRGAAVAGATDSASRNVSPADSVDAEAGGAAVPDRSTRSRQRARLTPDASRQRQRPRYYT